MSAILDQLELNQTFFFQLVLFYVLFLALTRVYFRPFMALLEARHKKTVEDREAAERLLKQADSRFEEYNRRLLEERQAARKEYEEVLTAAKKEESTLLNQSREEAKKITQEALDSIAKQRETLRRQLEVEVESMAHSISEQLLSRKV